jgi:hypothetical protein
MKLFRMAFWLGVVICNLPSPASRPAAPESQLNRSQGLAAQAASQFCPQPLETCARIDAVLSKRGELRGPNFSRDAAKPCQDTLAPADREVPWRGRATLPIFQSSFACSTRSLREDTKFRQM